MMTATTTHRAPTSLNLAALVAPVSITLLNGSTHTAVFTAHAAELYREFREIFAAQQRGDTIDDLAAEKVLDDCVAAVLPTATPDDLASLGLRYEYKMAVLAAASGRVDEILAALEVDNAAGKTTRAEDTAPSTPDTTSAP